MNGIIILIILICIVLVFSIVMTIMIDRRNVRVNVYQKMTDDVSILFENVPNYIKDDEII